MGFRFFNNTLVPAACITEACWGRRAQELCSRSKKGKITSSKRMAPKNKTVFFLKRLGLSMKIFFSLSAEKYFLYICYKFF
jgi:hypothetical protein